MLSRLISLLSRIPAVKWAVNRLRPLPHSGSLDVAPVAADEQSEVVAAAGPALDIDISAEPEHRDAEVTSPVAEHGTVASIIAESSSATPTDICLSDDASPETPAEVERIVVEDVQVSAVEIESIEVPEPLISDEATSDDDAEIVPVVAEQAIIEPVEIETVPVEASEPGVEVEPVSAASVEIEPVAANEPPVVVVDNEIAAPDVAEASIDSEPAPSVATEIEPIVAADPEPVVDAVAPDASTAAPEVAEQVELAPPAPKSSPKLRAKPAEPTDRAALIRQRWAETGIRMWNPRLHGTGEATLNIQGRIGLLPPEPGETMPRYDKLEFKLLGGQIVCEGVIVEAPVHAGQRSFTRLAEPRSTDRTHEPVRERQAALA